MRYLQQEVLSPRRLTSAQENYPWVGKSPRVRKMPVPTPPHPQPSKTPRSSTSSPPLLLHSPSVHLDVEEKKSGGVLEFVVSNHPRKETTRRETLQINAKHANPPFSDEDAGLHREETPLS